MLANIPITKPVLTPQELLAWVAGFVDGDGCLQIVKQTYKSPERAHRPNYRPRLTISQSDPTPLMRVRKILGLRGCLAEVHTTAQNNSTPYNLTYDGRAAMEAIDRLAPYLFVKRPQALAMLAFQAQCKLSARSGPRGHPPQLWDLRERFYLKLMRMK